MKHICIHQHSCGALAGATKLNTINAILIQQEQQLQINNTPE